MPISFLKCKPFLLSNSVERHRYHKWSRSDSSGRFSIWRGKVFIPNGGVDLPYCEVEKVFYTVIFATISRGCIIK